MSELTERYLDTLTGRVVRIYLTNNTVLKGLVVWHDAESLLLETGSKVCLFFRHAIMSIAVPKEGDDE